MSKKSQKGSLWLFLIICFFPIYIVYKIIESQNSNNRKNRTKVANNQTTNLIKICIILFGLLAFAAITELMFEYGTEIQVILYIIICTSIIGGIVWLKSYFKIKKQKQLPVQPQTNFAEIPQCNVNAYDLLIMKIDSLSTSGVYFEKIVCELLKADGYENVSVTQASSDYGIDVIAEKNGCTYAIQCKSYSSTVSNKAVQEAFTGKEYYSCKYAVVITNSFFSENAVKMAKKINVLLWDRTELLRLVNQLSPEEIQHLVNLY